MIFLKYEIVSENIGKVYYVSYMPFDREHGLGKSVDELKQEGILVETIPEPENNGMIATLYINPDTKEMWYEYEEPPLTGEQKIDLMNEKLDLIMMNQLEMEGIL